MRRAPSQVETPMKSHWKRSSDPLLGHRSQRISSHLILFASIRKRKPKQRIQKTNLSKQCACSNVCDEKGSTGVLDAGSDATAPEQATSL